jgi:hypothetical protein
LDPKDGELVSWIAGWLETEQCRGDMRCRWCTQEIGFGGGEGAPREPPIEQGAVAQFG